MSTNITSLTQLRETVSTLAEEERELDMACAAKMKELKRAHDAKLKELRAAHAESISLMHQIVYNQGLDALTDPFIAQQVLAAFASRYNSHGHRGSLRESIEEKLKAFQNDDAKLTFEVRMRRVPEFRIHLSGHPTSIHLPTRFLDIFEEFARQKGHGYRLAVVVGNRENNLRPTVIHLTSLGEGKYQADQYPWGSEAKEHDTVSEAFADVMRRVEDLTGSASSGERNVKLAFAAE